MIPSLVESYFKGCFFIVFLLCKHVLLYQNNVTIGNAMKNIEYDFQYYSQLAARTERSREYGDAATLWKAAAMLATNLENIEWAMHRKLFCVKMAQYSC